VAEIPRRRVRHSPRAILAANPDNTQPWTFHVTDRTIDSLRVNLIRINLRHRHLMT